MDLLPEWLHALVLVLFIDVVLAGDNAIVVGIVLAGGVLLLWVCWKMYRELRAAGADAEEPAGDGTDGAEADAPARKTLRQAIVQILVADVSMSLDNVLAVAGAAKEHPLILVIGLAISVVLMGVAATLIARLLDRHRWIAWIGLLVILYVALNMIYEGTHQVTQAVPEAYAYLFLPLGFLVPAIAGVFPVWLWVFATFLQVVFYAFVVTLVAGAARALRQPAVPG